MATPCDPIFINRLPHQLSQKTEHIIALMGRTLNKLNKESQGQTLNRTCKRHKESKRHCSLKPFLKNPHSNFDCNDQTSMSRLLIYVFSLISIAFSRFDPMIFSFGRLKLNCVPIGQVIIKKCTFFVTIWPIYPSQLTHYCLLWESQAHLVSHGFLSRPQDSNPWHFS